MGEGRQAGRAQWRGSTDAGGGIAKDFPKDKRPRSPLVLGPRASKSAALCGPPGPPARPARPRPWPPAPAAPVPSPAEGPARSGLRGRELPRGQQQLVSPQGAAPPFPGTKAAARAGAPGGRPRGGAARALGSRTSEMGQPQGSPQTSHLSGRGPGRCPGRVCRARGERAERARGPRPGGACLPRDRDRPQGDRGASAVGGRLRNRAARGVPNQRLGNLLQSSDS